MEIVACRAGIIAGVVLRNHFCALWNFLNSTSESFLPPKINSHIASVFNTNYKRLHMATDINE